MSKISLSCSSRKKVRFAVCTRNRPNLVYGLIKDISSTFAEAFPEETADFYIFNDSTQSDCSRHLENIVRDDKWPNLKLHLIEKSEFHDLVSSLKKENPDLTSVIESAFKDIGSGAWDLAGVRNFAFLYLYLVTEEDDIIIFLDDDIRFTNLVYSGYFFEIEGSRVIQAICQQIQSHQASVVGVGYWGRTDISIIKHLHGILSDYLDNLQKSLNQEVLQDLIRDFAGFPAGLPICCSIQDNGYKAKKGQGPGGISGAVLAIKRRSIFSHSLPRWYNEDWIWLLLHDYPTTEIKCLEYGVVHAAPPQDPLSRDFVIYQEKGEIIFEALAGLCHIAPATPNKTIWLEKHLSLSHLANSRRLSVKRLQECLVYLDEVLGVLNYSEELALNGAHYQSLLTDILSAHQFLSDVLEGIAYLNLEGLHTEILTYLQGRNSWQRLLAIAMEKSR